MSEGSTRGRFGRLFFAGCVTAAVLSVAVPVGGWFYWDHVAQEARKTAAVAQEQAATEQFDPVLEAMKPSRSEGPGSEQPYDIDKTVRVIHEIDLAMKREGSIQEYLRRTSGQDYSDVAPEVLEARREMLEVLMKLYAKQTEVEDQAALWEITSEFLLSTLSVVAVEGDMNLVSPEAGLSVDREQARQLLTELKDQRSERRQLTKDLASMEGELFETAMTYSEVYYRYLAEWDQLSVLRDRAYLAARAGDWEAVRTNAELAIERSPTEREAHLLLALALIELGNSEDDARITEILDEYVQNNPGSTAPALLLMGVQQSRAGNASEALLSFQQAAAYYPKQADQLTDMLDPYKMRSFLRKSREGQFIVEQYKSTMLGAGYFSPDLQMAKVAFQAGDDEGGRAKVLDHFARRRSQSQWDFIISDMHFCQELLGPDFWKIFPEDTYLDLEVSPTLMGSSLNLSVNNRSSRVLHNATLVLALQLTDMYAGDYEALRSPETVPAVDASTSTSFGSIEIDLTVDGQQKTVDDIVLHRAILITDEAVSWVDTDEYRISEAKEFRDRKRVQGRLSDSDAPVVHPLAKRHPQFQSTVDNLLSGTADLASAEFESKYGKDNIVLQLPRELAILRPMFRLKYGDTLYEAEDNVIDGDHIELRFAGVENFDADGAPAPDDLQLIMASPFGDVQFDWRNNGDLSWRFAGSDRVER